MSDIREECGVFGVVGPGENVANLAYFANLAQQHRGQESSGIATSDGDTICCETNEGRVDGFSDGKMQHLMDHGVRTPYLSIGHVRYSNTGGNVEANFQPVVKSCAGGELALAHNGNIISPELIATKLKAAGLTPEGTSDSELIALLIALETYSHQTFEGAIKAALQQITGAYSLVILHQDKLYGIRDPWGIRPLSLGRINGSDYMLASETTAFMALGAKAIQEIDSGQMVVIAKNATPVVSQLLPVQARKLCIFEYVYFAGPGSILYDCQVQTARRHMGEELWAECPVDIQDPRDWIVCGVPDSSTPAARGYGIASGLEERDAIIKNRYVGRTFIQPDQRMRELGVRIKLYFLEREIQGKKVVLIEDSIVRATTIMQVVPLVFEMGALEVHVRITYPQYKYPYFMGTDTQNPEKLVAHTKSVEEVCKLIGATSLGHLSIEGVVRAIDKAKRGDPIGMDQFCTACATGEYPFPVFQGQCRNVLEQ